MSQLMKIIFALWLAVLSLGASAQVDADPMPGDPRLVKFAYDENNSFRVFTRPMATTHIQLDNDERVKILALGDTVGWISGYRDNNVFIKPRYANISTPGTLITSKRTYQFMFRSTSDNGRWYQRVTFADPGDAFIEAEGVARTQLATSAATDTNPAPAKTEVSPVLPLAPELLNFNYDITGDANVKPINIFDDGQSTYIQIKNPSDVPAVFRLLDKDLELVEYVLRANTIIVPRVLSAGLLKLGKEEARFYNRTKVTKSLFGNYDLGGASK